MTNSRFLRHEPCEKCGSTDANSVYDDGHSYCFACNAYVDDTNDTQDSTTQLEEREVVSLPMGEFTPIPDRKINQETCKMYGVTTKVSLGDNGKKKITEHYYPYYNTDGQRVAVKIRELPKNFRCSGLMNDALLFGQPICPPGGKFITIVEGEADALAYTELTGKPCVSVKSATSALKDCRKQFEYLNSFETIVICFDRDEVRLKDSGEEVRPGQDAAEKVASLFAGKSKIMDMTYKDPCEYLKRGEKKLFNDQWWGARSYSPAGLVTFDDSQLKDLLANRKKEKGMPYPWESLNEMTFGMRKGEMITFTGGTGMGKTQVLREIVYHIHNHTEENIGMLMLEEPKNDTFEGLVSIHASKPLHLPTTEYSDEDFIESAKFFTDKGRITIFDAFGSNEIDVVIGKIRELVKIKECKFVVLDHISIIVSDQRSGDERRALDEIATKLKTLTVELEFCLIIVSHLRRTSGKPHEEGGQTSLADLRGTAGIGQLSNFVIGLERNGQSDDEYERRKTTIRVLKNRFCGFVGPAATLIFDPVTHRLNEEEELDIVEDDG